MTEHTILFHIKVRPGKEQQFLEVMRDITEHTIKEPGCLVFELRREKDDPLMFVAFHSYVDKSAFDVHFNAPYHLGRAELRESIENTEWHELAPVGYSAEVMRRADRAASDPSA